MGLDAALLVLGVVALAYCLWKLRQTQPARRRGTALRRTRTVYFVGAAAAVLLITGSALNLLGN